MTISFTLDEDFKFSVISSGNIRPMLADFQSDIEREGPSCILNHRDLVYTIINSSKDDHDLKKVIGKHLIKCLQLEIRIIREIVQEEHVDSSEAKDHRNCLKIMCYMLCHLYKNMILTNIKEGSSRKNRGRSKKIEQSEIPTDKYWLTSCETYFDLLIELLSLQINKLWQPPIIEQEFIRLIMDFYFKFLETPILCKMKPLFMTLAALTGKILSKNEVTFDIVLKVVNIVRNIENMSLLMASFTYELVVKYNCQKLIIQLFKELSRVKTCDNIVESNMARNTALFISNIGKLMPKEFVSNCSLIICHLDNDPYCMRNAVLDCLGYVIINIYSNLQLDEITRKGRDHFLDRIEMHMHDVNAYVRSHVLHIWSDIAKEKIIPINRFNALTKLTLNRMSDKSCNVRKNAAILLLNLLCNNPFATKLNISQLEANLKEQSCNSSESTKRLLEICSQEWVGIETGFQNFLNSITFDDHVESLLNTENLRALSEENKSDLIEYLKQGKYSEAYDMLRTNLLKDHSVTQLSNTLTSKELIKYVKNVYFEFVSLNIINFDQHDTQDDIENDGKKLLLAKINYLNDALTFAKLIKSYMPVIYKLLISDTINDIIEVVQLIITICKFEIIAIDEVIDHVLPLIWTHEPQLKVAVCEAFSVLLTTHSKDPKEFVDKLISVIDDCPIGILDAIEELIGYFSETQTFSLQAIKYLWGIFQDKNKPMFQRSNSICILGMLSCSQPTVIYQNLEVIAYSGFSNSSPINLVIASCAALTSFIHNRQKVNDSLKYKVENNHILIKKLLECTSERFTDKETSLWTPLCEHVIIIITLLTKRPFVVAREFLKSLFRKIQFSSNDGKHSFDLITLGRLFYCIGQSVICFQHLIDTDVREEIRNRIKNFSEAEKAEKINDEKSALNGDAEDDILPSQLDHEDIDSDIISDLNTEIFNENSIFFRLLPIIYEIISQYQSFPEDILLAATTLLLKLMFVSHSCCSKNLQIIFSLLKKCSCEPVKNIIIVMLGDIIQKFPNLIDPWMPHVFAVLKNGSVELRKVVLSVLSSLILNDMVKVKGHISELVLCVEDEDKKLATCSKLFFQELAKKDNAIYNILPDIISRLSEVKNQLKEGTFQRVMKFILRFLEKEKQCESLVDKLCHRISLTRETSEVLDLLYCLSQLSMSEKSFKKLIDNFSCYKDKIYDDDVYNSMLDLLTKFKKACREEMKAVIEDFEKKLDAAHTRGIADIPVSNTLCNEEEIVPESQNIDGVSETNSVRSLKRPIKQKIATPKRTPRITNKRSRKIKKLLASNSDESEYDNAENKLKK